MRELSLTEKDWNALREVLDKGGDALRADGEEELADMADRLLEVVEMAEETF